MQGVLKHKPRKGPHASQSSKTLLCVLETEIQHQRYVFNKSCKKALVNLKTKGHQPQTIFLNAQNKTQN